MSYDVDTWKTKELNNLRIPCESLYKHERHDWHPTQSMNDDGSLTWSVMDGSQITGTVEDGVISVTDIEAVGEGSGCALRYVFDGALAESTGTLIVSRVWEGGDTIDKLTVIDGQVTEDEIDI